MTKIKLSDIEVKLGGKNEPKDEMLIGLLTRAYSGKLQVRTALIDA